MTGTSGSSGVFCKKTVLGMSQAWCAVAPAPKSSFLLRLWKAAGAGMGMVSLPRVTSHGVPAGAPDGWRSQVMISPRLDLKHCED